ncbi:uncharacterized protein LOC119072203 [Bradysia coprophila]|uniref:uncharacterized protein LOC119072203 n=1 Tax=Bradysia coprophila TaxID=38358 RepID=UPI00187DA7B0|nr:uncharacterized protein LOC119072203 [Bradysia coprophila]
MNSETIKGRLSQHVKRRLQSQESIENKIHPNQIQPSAATTVIRNQVIIKQEDESESTVKSVKKRKMTKKSSSHSVESNPDEDEKCDNRSDKVDTSLDILTLILNHKKSEFLRNPEIVQLLCDINKKKSTTLDDLIQSQ